MHLMPRQDWRVTTSTSHRPTPTTIAIPTSCTPFTLYPGDEISLGPDSTLTLTGSAVATPECFTSIYPSATATAVAELDNGGSDEELSASDLRDPFYASTIPMAYSISATTTLAYVLLFLLFLPNPPNSRPWLQKVATLTVVVCLTIAFAETTTVLEEEYRLVGSSLYSLTNEAREVRRRVVGGTVIRVGRIVSDLFLWLAQVQTLIRLFPREREKVIIKWAGFCLILLDTVFSILQSFVSPLTTDPDSFLDAIPALSYLFQIALSLLYASCVIYYSFAKRKYSYFYPYSFFKPSTPGSKQYGGRSIVLVATLSIASVLTPIVFFVLDIAQKDLAGWGDYIRWVGAASASAVVWEWVDRIEGLEREERKGGVLGREVFDEDEEEDGFQGDEGTRRRSGHCVRHDDRGAGGAGGLPLSRTTTLTTSTAYAVNVRRVDTADTFLRGFPAPSSSGGVRGRMTPGTVRSGSTVSVRRGDTPAIEEEGEEQISPRPVSVTVDDQSEKDIEWEDDYSRSDNTPIPQPPNTNTNTNESPPSLPENTTIIHPPPPPPIEPPSTIWPWRKRRRRDHEHDADSTTTSRIQAAPRMPLPVTIIPAPPRGAQGSWSAVERARALAEAEQAERVERARIAAGVELPPSRSTFRTDGRSVDGGTVRDWGGR